jgi:hypothetical protein
MPTTAPSGGENLEEHGVVLRHPLEVTDDAWSGVVPSSVSDGIKLVRSRMSFRIRVARMRVRRLPFCSRVSDAERISIFIRATSLQFGLSRDRSQTE